MTLQLAASRVSLDDFLGSNLKTKKYNWSSLSFYYILWNDPDLLESSVKFELLPVSDALSDTRYFDHRHLLVSPERGIAAGFAHHELSQIVRVLNLQVENNDASVPEFEIMDYLFLHFLVKLLSSDTAAQVQGSLNPSYSQETLRDPILRSVLQNSTLFVESVISRGFQEKVYGMTPAASVPLYWLNHFSLHVPIYTEKLASQESLVSGQGLIQYLEFAHAYNRFVLKFTRSTEESRTNSLYTLFLNAVFVRATRVPSELEAYFLDRPRVDVAPIRADDNVSILLSELTRNLVRSAGLVTAKPIQGFEILLSYQSVKCYFARIAGSGEGKYAFYAYFSPVINSIYPNMWRMFKVKRTSGKSPTDSLTRFRAQVVSWKDGDSSEAALSRYATYYLLEWLPDSAEFVARNYLEYLANPLSFQNKVVLSNQRDSHDILVKVPEMFVSTHTLSATHHWLITSDGRFLIWNRRHAETDAMIQDTIFILNAANREITRAFFNVINLLDLFPNLKVDQLKKHFEYGQSTQFGCKLLRFADFSDFQYPIAGSNHSAVSTGEVYLEMRGNQLLIDDNKPVICRGLIQVSTLKYYDPRGLPIFKLEKEKIRIIRTILPTQPPELSENSLDYCKLHIGEDVFYFPQYGPNSPDRVYSVFDFGPIHGKYIVTRGGKFYQELNRNNIKVPLFLCYYIMVTLGLEIRDKNLLNIKTISEHYRISVSFSGSRPIKFQEDTEEKLVEVVLEMLKTSSKFVYRESGATALEPSISMLNAIIREKFFPHNATFLSFLIACGQLMERSDLYYNFAKNLEHGKRNELYHNVVQDRFEYIDLISDPESVRQFFHALNKWLYHWFQFWVMLLPIQESANDPENDAVITYAEYSRRLTEKASSKLGQKPSDMTRFYLVFMPHGTSEVADALFMFPILYRHSKTIFTNLPYAGNLKEYLAASHTLQPERFYVTIGSRAESSKYTSGGLMSVYFSETRRAYGDFSLLQKQRAGLSSYRIENVYQLRELMFGDQDVFSRILHDVNVGVARVLKGNVTELELKTYLEDCLSGKKTGAYQFVLYLIREFRPSVLESRDWLEKYFLAKIGRIHDSFADLMYALSPFLDRLKLQLSQESENQDARRTAKALLERVLILNGSNTPFLTDPETIQPARGARNNLLEKLFHFVEDFANAALIQTRYRFHSIFFQLNRELLSARLGALQLYTIKFRLLMFGRDNVYRPKVVQSPALFLVTAEEGEFISPGEGRLALALKETKKREYARMLNEIREMGPCIGGRKEDYTSAELQFCLSFMAMYQLVSPYTNIKRLRKRVMFYYYYLEIFIAVKILAKHFIQNELVWLLSVIYTCSKCTQLLQRFYSFILTNRILETGPLRQKMDIVFLFVKAILVNSGKIYTSDGDDAVTFGESMRLSAETQESISADKKFLERFYWYILETHLKITNINGVKTMLDRQISIQFQPVFADTKPLYNPPGFTAYTKPELTDAEKQRIEEYRELRLRKMSGAPAKKEPKDSAGTPRVVAKPKELTEEEKTAKVIRDAETRDLVIAGYEYEMSIPDTDRFIELCTLIKFVTRKDNAGNSDEKGSIDSRDKKNELNAKIQGILEGVKGTEKTFRLGSQTYDLEEIFLKLGQWRSFYLTRMRVLEMKLEPEEHAVVLSCSNDIDEKTDVVKQVVESEWTDEEQETTKGEKKTDNPVRDLYRVVKDEVYEELIKYIDKILFRIPTRTSAERKHSYHFVREIVGIRGLM